MFTRSQIILLGCIKTQKWRPGSIY